MCAFVAGILFVVALVALPATRSGPTTVLNLDGSEARFEGLRAAAASAPVLKILTVHGMGNEGTDAASRYAKKALDEVAGELGYHENNPPISENLEHPSLPSGWERSKLVRWSYEKPGNEPRYIEVYSVQWSPLVNGIKQERLLDSEIAHAPERVALNRKLKAGLLNEKLSEPVMYLGRMGKEIRYAIAQTICRMVGGTWTEPNCQSPGNLEAKIAILTWSLGSKATFDAIDLLGRGPRGEQIVRTLRKQTTHVYMFANQLPLLKLAEDPTATTKSMETSSVERSDTLATFIGEPLKGGIEMDAVFIAINDPNDLLSYPIPKDYQRRYAGPRFINALTPIARRHVSGFGANPLAAHTGHTDRPAVMKMLIEGW